MVPSRQRAHAATLAFAAAQLKDAVRVWATPDIVTLDAWLIRATEQLAAAAGASLPRLLSPPEEWLLWRQCTAEATVNLDLLNRGSLAESLRRASTLASEFGIDIHKGMQGAGAEAELLHSAQLAVDAKCRELGAVTAAQAADFVVAAAVDTSRVVGEGFLLPNRRLQYIGATQRSPSGSAQIRPEVVIASDETDELERIARWCQREIQLDPECRLLVILPGGAGSRERLATLIRQAVDPEGWLSTHNSQEQSDDTLVVIEGGSPLADVPVVAHALMTLKWLSGSSGEFVDASEWLRAPYWKTPSETERARIDLWLREAGQMSIDGREWGPLLLSAPGTVSPGTRDLADRISAGIKALGTGVVSPREWSERFRDCLDAVGWPGDRVRDSGEQQTVVRLHELLDEFGQLASSTRSMSREDAVHWFAELAARTAFRPADNDAVVTISGSLCDPIVLYDGIWVAGLHAEAFPQPVQPDPFIPLAAQIAAACPAASAVGRLTEARALLTAWRAATRKLVLSTPSRADDLELLPSPLLTQWVSAPVEAASPQVPVWLPNRLHRSNLLERLDDSIGVPWSVSQILPSGTRSLELQNLCAFRAYSELRLGSSELGVPEPGVAPDQRGRLLHRALQVLWRQLRDSATLAQYAEESLEALIERCTAQAADELLGQAADGQRSPVFARECRRTARLIRGLCRLERTRNPFRVQETEFERPLTLAGARMNVRIDRLDTLESGGQAILDYKSGRRKTADWYGERPSHPQLLAYLAAVGDGVVAMATVNVTAREIRFDGIANSAQLIPKVRSVEGPGPEFSGDPWQLRTGEWLACIERLAAAFLAGSAVIDPKPGACDYCHAVSVCRISDRGIEVAAELLPEEYECNGH